MTYFNYNENTEYINYDNNTSISNVNSNSNSISATNNNNNQRINATIIINPMIKVLTIIKKLWLATCSQRSKLPDLSPAASHAQR